MFFVIFCSLFVACCWSLFVVACSFVVTCCLWFVWFVLFDVCCLLFGVWCFNVRYSWFVVLCCLLFGGVVSCLVNIVCRLLF